MESDEKTKKIVIVGGGTAGWLTAAFLSRILATHMPGGVAITVIESSEYSIIGVGEGTFPTIKNTLMAIGIDETRFMQAASATFKQGIRFVDWEKAPDGDRHSHYFHPFTNPYDVQGAELLPYWLLGCADPALSMVEATGVQQQIAESHRAPKRFTDKPYAGPLNYAYHFDAAKLANLLRDVSKELGVRHLVGTIKQVELAENGDISRILSEEHGALSADLFVDCSGFRAELIGKALKEPFRSCKDILLTDRAVTLQVPYERPDMPIESYTISTAHEAGWTWDIGLEARRGVGYVYSAAHTGDDRAEQLLRAHIGPTADGIEARRLRFETGFRHRQWVGNCVAVGLSAGFFEPLESTGIMLIEVAAHMISEFFPWGGAMAQSAAIYNRLMNNRHAAITDFLKLHYCLTKRSEPFWRDNADTSTIPASLQEKLAMWRDRPPSRFDFVGDYETFLPFSYQAVLYGMGFVTDLQPASATYRTKRSARQRFDDIKASIPRAFAEFPFHRDLINQIYGAAIAPAGRSAHG